MTVVLKSGLKYQTTGVGTMIGDSGILMVFRDETNKAYFINIEELWFIEE